MVATIQNYLAKIETLNMPIKIGSISTTFLVDSGSACSILNHSLASLVVNSSSHAFWVGETANRKLRTFSKESIQIEGKIQNPVMGNGWNTRFASFTVVADGLKPLTGCDLFEQLAFTVTQSTSQKGYQANFISPHSEFKEHIAFKFPDPIS